MLSTIEILKNLLIRTCPFICIIIKNHRCIIVISISLFDVWTYRNSSIHQIHIINKTHISDGPESNSRTNNRPSLNLMETSHGMEIARLLLSLLHAWGLDRDLDSVCQSKLGLLRPMVPVSFGVLSKAGYMSLFLPTWHQTIPVDEEDATLDCEGVPAEIVWRERLTRAFTSRTHWELSTTLTSNHLVAIIALSHTLMSMSNATFVPEQERNRKMHRWVWVQIMNAVTLTSDRSFVESMN